MYAKELFVHDGDNWQTVKRVHTRVVYLRTGEATPPSECKKKIND